MPFLHPSLLVAGLACIGIPILIHLLLRRRRRPVPWAAMRFLLEAIKQQRRRLKLEQLLLLAARCLLVLLLALAIARPLWNGGSGLGGGAPRVLYLLIDNSLTGSAVGVDGVSALDGHRARALQLLDGLDATRGDRAALIPLASPAEGVVLPASRDLPAVRRLVEQLRATDARADWSGALALAASGMASDSGDEGASTLAVLSGFRLGSLDASLPARALDVGATPGGGAGFGLVASPPAEEPLSNVTIASVEPLQGVLTSAARTQGGSAEVRVRLLRSGGSLAAAAGGMLRVGFEEARATPGAGATRGTSAGLPTGPVTTGPATRGPATGESVFASRGETPLRWSDGQRTQDVIVSVPRPAAVSGESMTLVAELDGDAIPGDNRFVRPVAVRDQIRVGLIASRGNWQEGVRGVGSFRPGDWLALVLEPRAGQPTDEGDVALQWIEPSAVAASLDEPFDAFLVPSPDRVSDEGWRALAERVRRGAMLAVFPSPDQAVQLWPDVMRAELGPVVEIAREASAFAPPRGVQAASGWTGGWGGSGRASVTGGFDPLALVAGELDELVQSVTVTRLVPLAIGAGEDTGVLAWPVLEVQGLASGGQGVARGREEGAGPERGLPLVVCAVSADESGDSSGVAGVGAGEASGAARGPERGQERGLGRGTLVVFAVSFDLAWTNLPARPFVVPLMQELVRQGVGRSGGASAQSAGGVLRAPLGAVELRLTSAPPANGPSLPSSLALSSAGVSRSAVRDASLWAALDARGATVERLAVHADAAAGSVEVQSRDQVQRWLAGVGGALDAGVERAASTRVRWLDDESLGGESGAAALRAPESDASWSVVLLVAAGLVALAELVMGKLFSHAYATKATGAPGNAASGSIS
ncbi:MAG: BatA domain-containing protein [Planctomycetota bacterium]|nr:BatA domain-containing protein [Planctomycetota bacterium]